MEPVLILWGLLCVLVGLCGLLVGLCLHSVYNWNASQSCVFKLSLEEKAELRVCCQQGFLTAVHSPTQFK